MNRKIHSLSWFFIGAGLVLAVLSGTDLCTFGGCTDAHQFRLYGLPLATVGILYFSLLAFAHGISFRIESAARFVTILLAGGAGAELTMIHLQKNVIQAWCPLCLGIAGVVYILCFLRIYNFFSENRRTTMRTGIFGKSLLMSLVALAGFLISFNGIVKPEAAAQQQDISLGKQKSPVEVYIFSDWLCPVCLKVEPALEAALPGISQRARITFVDKAIHPESMNFVPYHLSFAINEKDKYLPLRKVLFEVARKTRNPSVDDIKTAIAPLKVSYKQLSFMDVTQYMAKFQALSDQFKVKATPTVVVYNSKTGKSKSLVGGSEISVDGLLKAVKSLE